MEVEVAERDTLPVVPMNAAAPAPVMALGVRFESDGMCVYMEG